MKKCCDLHLHSRCSDGSLSPVEVALAAKKAGVSAAILTDHNTIQGTGEFLGAAAAIGLEAAAGTEISCDYQGQEVHILGLFLPIEKGKDIRSWFAGWEEGKQRSNQQLAERLRAAGIPLSYEEMKIRYRDSRINRMHFAKELCRLGFSEDIQEAFSCYLKEDKGYYTPAPRPEAGEVIQIIRSWGAVPVLAHPPLNVAWKELPAYFAWAKGKGAVAAEVYYSIYEWEEQQKMKELCQEAGLEESGGSDFHGSNKNNIAIGTGRGHLCVPYDIYERLKAKREMDITREHTGITLRREPKQGEKII